MKVIIAGSSGFIGSALVAFLRKNGHEVNCLVREEKAGSPYWNPEERRIDKSLFLGVDCVINLAGENIFGRWSQKKMDQIRDSRLKATAFLCETLLSLPTPPKVYIGASAIGIYGDRKEEKLTEKSGAGHGFLAELCQKCPPHLSSSLTC